MSDNATHGSGPRPDLRPRSRVSGPVGEGPRPPSRPRLCRRASERRSMRVGNALDLPNERIRGWLEDMIPDPVQRSTRRSITAGSIPNLTARPPPRSSSNACARPRGRELSPSGRLHVPAVTPGERVTSRMRAAEIIAAFDPCRRPETPTCHGSVMLVLSATVPYRCPSTATIMVGVSSRWVLRQFW